jgi:peptidoglycan hydrolase-like protein with peptidoglycan-binding domain
MLPHTCARRMVGPLAVASLLVAMLVMAPGALATTPPAPSATSSLLAEASWHGRPIVHPRKPDGPRAALPRIRSIHGWSAGAARRGLGFVRVSGSKRVREVQRLLVRIGYRPGRIDGRFGPRTEAAVIAFQYKHGFVRSGVVGSRTLNALRLRAGWPAGWAAGAVGRGTGYSRPGGSARVRQAQQALNALGYEAGPMDGLFGPRTEAATLRFQRSHGLPAGGVVERRTLHALLARPPAALGPGGGDARGRTPAGRAPVPQARVGRIPALPTIPILLGLAALAVLVTTISYVSTGRRLRRGRPDPGGWGAES